MNQNEVDLQKKIAALIDENDALRARLEEASETLRAIRAGEVDALVVYSQNGERIYTLEGADYPYRVMVESLHEGAAYIRADGTILYCNRHLSDMVGLSHERFLSMPFHSYVTAADRETFAALLQRGLHSDGTAELSLECPDGRIVPVLINAGAARVDDTPGVCLAVTDLTEQKLAAAREKELQRHLREQREQERNRIARNLHDGPLQELIGLSYAIQSLAADASDPAAAGSLQALRETVLKLASELRAVTNEMRSPTAVRFGLVKAIRYLSEEFQARRPEPRIILELEDSTSALSKDAVGALFRIYKEAINNVYRHAGASEVHVRLLRSDNSIILEIEDDGVGFDAPEDWTVLARGGHLGLIGMWERAEAVGGKIDVRSTVGEGTVVRAVVACEPQKATAD